jgi:hypothetical protein
VPDARIIPSDIFHPAASLDLAQGADPPVDFMNYMIKVSNRWVEDRAKWFYSCPADVQRSIVATPRDRHADGSWAAVVAEAVLPAAAHDLRAAIDLAGWVVEPGQRLLALCAAAVAMKRAAVPGTMILALRGAADDLVRYVPVYPEEIGRFPFLAYIDPSARALFEAALLLPSDMSIQIPLTPRLPASAYLRATFVAQQYWELLAAPYSLSPDLVHEIIERIDGHGDQIQADLVRGAAATRSDPATAETIVASIGTSWIAALTRIHLAVRSGCGPAHYLPILQGIGEDGSAVQRAELAATAYMVLCEQDEQAALACAEWGAAAAREGDPDQAACGLAALTAVTGSAGLFEECLARSDKVANLVSNPYLVDRVMVRLLQPALRTGHTGLLVETVRRLVESGWTVLMQSLREAISPLVTAAGPQIVLAIDEALRAAQAVVGDVPGKNFDGVAVPDRRPGPGWLPLVKEPDESYLSLFLSADALPGMTQYQDWRIQDPSAEDEIFTRLGGIRAGYVIWHAHHSAAIQKLFDFRWIFPDEDAAAQYHRERLEINGEGLPRISDAPTIGQECAVYGGTIVRGSGDTEITRTMFCYLFRVGTAVVKLFASKGIDAPEEALTPAHVADLAEKIVVAARHLSDKPAL